MTVLAKYQRLEAEAIWRPDPEAQRRDVIVAIGEATLTISTANGTALAHWSLPAIERLNPGDTPALYRPGEDSPETLELAEPEMIAAVEKVLQAIHRGSAPTGRAGRLITMGVGLVILAAAGLWLPDAIIRYTASLVPGAARASIGTALLGEMDRVAGAPCATPSGQRSLDSLKIRLFGTDPTKLVVLPSALAETTHLPGGAILISHKLVEDFETPEVLAGYLLAEDIRRRSDDPLARLLDMAGLRAALVLLSQGKVPDAALKRMAEGVVAEVPGPVSYGQLIARMAESGVATEPYGRALDLSGETTVELVSASTISEQPVLSDGEWIALQRICEN